MVPLIEVGHEDLRAVRGVRNLLQDGDRSRVVTVVGKTGVGKSTMIKAMLEQAGHDDADGGMPRVADAASVLSTTAEMKLHALRNSNPAGDENMLLIDCEGMNAGTTAPLEAKAGGHGAPKWTQEQIEARNEIVKIQLPRIAFTTSSIIIAVTEHNWRVADSWKDPLEFARHPFGCAPPPPPSPPPCAKDDVPRHMLRAHCRLAPSATLHQRAHGFSAM